MKELSLQNIKEITLGSVGLSNAYDLNSTEALAALLRRTAAFLCPCSSKAIIDTAAQSLSGIIENSDLKGSLEKTLEGLLSYGDLFEFDDPTADAGLKRSLLYTAPLSFVRRGKGSIFLIGVAIDRPLILSDEIHIEYQGFTRRISETAVEDLVELGFLELSLDVWLKTPPKEEAAQYIQRLDHALNSVSYSGSIPDLIILDSNERTRFYPDRWVSAKTQSGRFVGRRPQPYGNNLWCYVELDRGQATKLIDLPLGKDRGCDEGWRLQQAIDKTQGRPQKITVKKVSNEESIIEFFSPIPRWAKRRFDIMGRLVDSPGGLFSYAFSGNEVEEEVNFVHQLLWLEKT